MSKKSVRPGAMAFYNPKGLVPAFQHATAFAGNDGRVATLPDIIRARLATKPGDCPWESCFTTMSAEYVGLSKAGNPIAVVAHGIGPMSTLDGIMAAYSYEYKDKSRHRRGGRIPQKEFLKLANGFYGAVEVVDLAATWRRRPFQFSNHAVTAKEIMEELLWQARLGAKWQEYIEHHAAYAREWHFEQSGVDPENRHNLPGHAQYCDRRRKTHLRLAGPGSFPCILSMADAANCSYSDREMFNHWMQASPNMALAHLLSIGGLIISFHDYYELDYDRREQRESLASDVSCHEWMNGTRLVGFRPGSGCIIHPGLPDFPELIKNHLDLLWVESPEGRPAMSDGFWHLIPVAEEMWFTDCPKQGEGMDKGEPEFYVKKLRAIPGKYTFRTTIGGYHGLFKYGIEEVRRIAPPKANAYTVGDIEIESKGGSPTHHVAQITFYEVKVDTTRRLIREEEVYRNFDLIMSLVG